MDAAMNVRLGAKTKEFNKKLAQSTKKIQKFGKSVQSVGKKMSTMVTLPLLAAGGASLKMSMDFQKSMTKIQTLVGRTDQDIERMKAGIMDMSLETAKSPVELAEGLYFLESAGLSGANAMETLETVAKGSAAGLGEMEALSVVAAAAQNAYGEETLSASDALDKFGVMVRTGMFDAQELSNVLGRQLGLAANLGVSFDEVGALISTYTQTTGDATSASNGLSAIMMTFAKLDSEPTKKQAEALGQIGMTAGDVKTMIGSQGLQGTLLHLQKEFDANGVSMASFFGQSQALKGVLGVLGSQTEAYEQNLLAMGDSVGFVGGAFNKTAETDAFKMEQAMNSLKVAGTTFGDQLAPAVSQIASVITDLTKKFSSLDDSTKKNIGSALGYAAVIGPLLVIVGKGIVIFSKARKAILLFKTQVAAAGGVMKFFNAVMAANPIGFLITVIAAVVGAIYYFSTSSSKVAVTVRNAFYTMINFAIKAINALIKAVNKVSEALGLGTIPVIKEFKKETYKAKEEVKDTSKEVEDLAKNISNVKAPKIDMSGVNVDSGGGSDSGGDDTRVEDEKKTQEQIEAANEKSLENIRLLKQKFNVLNAKDDQEAARIRLANERENALLAVDESETAEEEKQKIRELYDKKLEKLLEKQEADNKKNAENTATEWEKTYDKLKAGWQAVSNVANQVFGGITSALDAINAKEEQELENKQAREDEDYEIWYERELQKLEDSVMTEEQKEKALEKLEVQANEKRKALDEDQAKEKAKIQKKQAKQEKAMKIFSAVMGTAAAIVQALAVAPPLGFVLAGVVAALGAIQVAAIKSTPLPALAEGGIAFGPTTAIVGEYSGASANPEVIAPLDKLKSMLGSETQKIEVFGRIEGNDIVISNNLTTNKRLRYT